MNLKDVPVIDLDLYYRESNQPDYLKTDDANGRYRKYRLAYGGTPMDLTGVTARCYMLKADGKSVYIDAEIEGNVVTVCFTNQALACPGVLKVEIVLYGSDNSEISSFIMEYVVIKSLRNPDTLESTNEFSALVSTINTVNDLQAKEQLIQAREAVRMANEDTRIATEATRESDEETRKNNEVTRQSNETTRVDNENTREGKEFTRQQDEITRNANEVTRQSNETGRVNAESTRVAEFNDIKNQWNSLSPDQASNVEVQQARRDVKGVVHDSLSKRLESDSKMRDTLEETKEGTYLTFDGSVPSPITNVIVKGNTYQNPNNLVEIVSSGIDNGDGTWTYEVVACGENLFNGKIEIYGSYYNYADGALLNVGSSDGTTYPIRVAPNTQYTFSNFHSNVTFWDKDLRFISGVYDASTVTTPSNAMFIRCLVLGANLGVAKLHEGTIATPYTPYEENRCTIKLPCQLERWDILYFNKVDNAWCVDKYTLTEYIKNLKDWSVYQNTAFQCSKFGDFEHSYYDSSLLICNSVKSDTRVWDKTTEYISSDGNKRILINLLADKNPTLDIPGLRKWAIDTNAYFMVKAKVPKKIALPQSEQIKLNALANQTNVYVNSGALSAIISATVAKSHTSATLANTDKIIDVENRLQRVIDNKDDVEYTYKSTNGYVVAKDTNRGNISKATIRGKSLVNMFEPGNIYQPTKYDLLTDGFLRFKSDFAYGDFIDTALYRYKPNTEYTFIIESRNNTLSDSIYFNTADKRTIFYDPNTPHPMSIKLFDAKADGVKLLKLKTMGELLPTTIFGFMVQGSNLTGKIELRVTLLEGSIDTVPGYFDRTIHVSNPNGLELNTVEKSLDYVTELVTAQKRKNFRLKEPIQPNSVLTNVSNKPIIALLFDITSPDTWTQDITIAPGASYTIPTNRIAKIITIYPHNGWIIENEVYLEELVDIDGYPRRDTNKIFYRDGDGEYQVLTELHEFDVIEDDKWYKRGDKKILNGAEGSMYLDAILNKTVRFRIEIKNSSKSGLCVCESMPSIEDYNLDSEHIYTSKDNFWIFVNKTRLATLDVPGLKKWLHDSPLPVIYQLAQEIIYPCNNINLGIFDGDTLVTTNATNVKPGFDVTMTSSINSLIGNIDDTLDSAVDDIQAIKHDVAKITSSKAYEFSGVGYKVMNDTEQGTLSELQIYGNSLVNLKDAVFKYDNVYIAVSFTRDLLPNTTYTVILNGFNKDNFRYHVCYNGDGSQPMYSSSDRMVVFTTPSNLINNARRVYIYPKDGYTITQSDVDAIKPLVLEGDHTQNPPQYFEGVASVGAKGGIDVRSNNGNLFNESLLRHRLEDDGYYHFRSSGNTRATLFMGIVDKFYKQITSMTSNQANDLTNLDLTDCKVLIGMNGDVRDDKELMPITEFGLGNFPIYKGCEYEIIDPNHIRVKSVYIKHGVEPGNYVPSESDTKPILYKDIDNTWKPVSTLHGVDENRRDIVDTSTNSYTSMMMKVVEVGEGGWQVSDGSKANTLMFFRMFNDNEKCELLQNNSKLSCDKFNPKYVYSLDEEGIFINRNSEASNGGVYIRISQNKLETRDVEGFKKWLQANNVSYVYKGNVVRKYEISPILTQVFDKSTLLQILCGAISAEFTAKCIASYSRRIESIESRLDRVEESVFKAVDVVSAMAMATDLRSIDLSNNVEQTQRAQDTMLMESDMRLMSMELLVNSTKPVSTDIKYVMYDAKGGATIMSASYYNFIAMCIANKTQSPEYLENYMNLCLQTGRLDQDEFDKLHAMLYPTTTEQPTK